MAHIPSDIAELLNVEAERLNSPDFIAADPVQFPRRYTEQRDVEAAALLCATIAWGKRSMICRNCERMLALMDGRPAAYIMDAAYEELRPEDNVHRTFLMPIFSIGCAGCGAFSNATAPLRVLRANVVWLRSRLRRGLWPER